MTMETFTPLEYLKIDIASNFGLDKKKWDERIAWFDKNEAQLESLIKEAKEPALFYAGILAYQKARKGLPIKYPISLDATSSGAQILSILIECEKSAKLCNVIDTGEREDLYTNIYQLMLDRLNDTAKISPDNTKQAIMTSLYGSKAMPRKVFGEGELLSTFYETMYQEAPGIWELNNALLGLWQSEALSHDWVLPDNFHVQTKVMVDHEETVHFRNRPYQVYSKVNAPAPDGLSLGANVVHSIDGMIVREILRRCMFDKDMMQNLIGIILLQKKHGHALGKSTNREKDQMVQTLWDNYLETGFLSARILEHLDEKNMGLVHRPRIEELILSMPEKPFSVLTVHDCFRVHPNYGNDLRKQYNQILHELAKSDVLASIASQILGHKLSVTKYNDISDDVLHANYTLS